MTRTLVEDSSFRSNDGCFHLAFEEEDGQTDRSTQRERERGRAVYGAFSELRWNKNASLDIWREREREGGGGGEGVEGRLSQQRLSW